MLAYSKRLSDNLPIMNEQVRRPKIANIISSFVRILLDVRALYALGGIIISVALHELFHILMHLGEIKQISLFPDSHAIITITTTLSSRYDLNIEEALAYSITILVLLVTVIDVCAIHDSRDKKNFSQTLFPHEKTLQKQDHQTLVNMAAKLKLI